MRTPRSAIRVRVHVRRSLAVLAIALPLAVGGSTALAKAGSHTIESEGGSYPSYIVQPGDGFYAIAEALGVDVNALLVRNGLSIDAELNPGDILLLPNGTEDLSAVPLSTEAAEAAETTPAAPQDPGATQPPATQAPSAPGDTQAPAPAPTPPPTPAPTAPPTPAPTAPPSGGGIGECVVGGIDWINNARAGAGVAGVGQGDASAACSHSRNMAEDGSMYHGAGSCGNEIVGYASDRGALPGAWLNSPGHYQVVTLPNVSSAAVAYVYNSNLGLWYGTGIFC